MTATHPVVVKSRRLSPRPARLIVAALHAAWIAAHAPEFVGPWEPVRMVRNRRPVLDRS